MFSVYFEIVDLHSKSKGLVLIIPKVLPRLRTSPCWHTILAIFRLQPLPHAGYVVRSLLL